MPRIHISEPLDAPTQSELDRRWRQLTSSDDFKRRMELAREIALADAEALEEIANR